jgi:hypothetical protein
VVIRFYPDAYTNAKGVKNASCFRRHISLDVPVVAIYIHIYSLHFQQDFISFETRSFTTSQ